MEPEKSKTHFFFFLFLLLLSSAAAQTPTATNTSAGPTDIITVLQKAGQFTTFIKLIKGTQVSDQINSQLSGSSSQGITVFAPTDNAFAGLKAGTLNSLTSDQQLRLVQYHVLPSFYALSQFETLSNPLHTQAGNSPLNVTASTSSQVNVTTGVVNATVGNTVYTDGQLAVFAVDKVLLPQDIFGTSLITDAPAAAPAEEEKPVKGKDGGDGTSAASDVSAAAVFGLGGIKYRVLIYCCYVSFSFSVLSFA